MIGYLYIDIISVSLIIIVEMAGLTTTDKAITFSYLKYLNDLCTSGKLSEESSEGLGGCYIVIGLIMTLMHWSWLNTSTLNVLQFITAAWIITE